MFMSSERQHENGNISKYRMNNIIHGSLKQKLNGVFMG